MKSIRKLTVYMILVGLAAGCNMNATNPATSFPVAGTQSPVAAATPTLERPSAYGPAFEVNTCPFEIPKGYHPICGTLTVPENRSQPGGRTIQLAVAIFKSSSPDPAPDPVIQLTGGPGSSALMNAEPIVRSTSATTILERRDYILFDQRGVGYSQPNLYCQPYDEYLWNAREQNISTGEYNAGALPYLENCLAGWRN